jgi:hypothetical protein
MNQITKYSDFEHEDDLLEVPRSIIEKWIRSIETQEDSINESIYAKKEMQDFLDNYKIESKGLNDDSESTEIDELSSDDEDSSFIKKFED